MPPESQDTKTPGKSAPMTPAAMRAVLEPVQTAKGYPFNADAATVNDLLEFLLINKARYGYAACPCRLANGVREKDRDVLCPCAYRAADVAEYGSCYCGLYVSPAYNAGTIPKVYVPDRRPPENIS